MEESSHIDVQSLAIDLSIKAAEAIAHKLSQPGKMPGYSWSIPAAACIIGSILKHRKGTSCESCYAEKGRYRWPNVVDALQKRMDGMSDSKWIIAMVSLLSSDKVRVVPYFRWFDSGDLQSVEHLDKICTIVRFTPFLKHWLPTREYKIVREYMRNKELPSNLVIRLSAPMIDGEPPSWWKWTSTIHDEYEPLGHVCPASTQGNNCGDCRACWDKRVRNVSYPLH